MSKAFADTPPSVPFLFFLVALKLTILASDLDISLCLAVKYQKIDDHGPSWRSPLLPI